MKATLKSMLISLLTGISFTVGVLLILLVKDIYVESRADEDIWIGDPDGVVISEHVVDTTAHDFTVTGRIRNESSSLWSTIHLEMDIFASDALVNNCDGRVEDLGPSSERNFRIECYKVSGQNLPENIHYKLRIRSGFRSD